LNRFDANKLTDEVTFSFSRSGGKGGQNVNKVETKVELVFNINDSAILDVEQKSRLIKKLHSKIDTEGNLHVVSQSERYQLANKKKAIEKFIDLIEKSLKKEKKRIKTKKPEAVKQKILEHKRKHSLRKKERKRVEIE
jgi:ribosome-associated protein